MCNKIGKKFSDAGDSLEGVVVAVALETNSKTLCFEYFDCSQLTVAPASDEDYEYIVANDIIAEAVWTEEVIIPTSAATVLPTLQNKFTATTTSSRLKPSWVMVPALPDDTSLLTSSRLRTRISSSSSSSSSSSKN